MTRVAGARCAVTVLAVVTGAATLLAACTAGEAFDRQAAMQSVAARYGGRLTDEQVACYVDRVSAEVGTAALDPNAELSNQQIGRLTSIRIDCIGVDQLGQGGGSTTLWLGPDDTWLTDQPWAPGDDPQLDLLFDACDRGAGAACDQLFDLAPPGSVYEEFALSCGDRTRELRCADVYQGDGGGSSGGPG